MIGTRPEAIKMSPVAAALVERGLMPTIIFTGQHAELNLAEHRLGALPAIHLARPGRTTPHRHVEEVRRATLTAMGRRPTLLMVQGDTSSALGATLAGVSAGVPIAHIEAGLRTHDRSQPWPEEEYRCRIDAEADLLFAPTELAARNLKDENVRGAIHVTGNTGIDALMEVERRLDSPAVRDPGAFRLLVTCHRRENWGDGVEALAAALVQLATDPAVKIDLVLHPNACLGQDLLGRFGNSRIRLHPPCSHRELVAMMRDSDLLLSDSGGMQEEAPALGTPMLVLREKTERPEAIATGNIRLVGCRAGDIEAAVTLLRSDLSQLASMSRRNFPYGDGRAAPRIASIVEHWMGKQKLSERRAV